ncbi:ABC transporter ATP-binding protein [Halovenus marina]|uniref:ABC transporter ATP-binding protein n=1 Tax=Halovenus marina TaxID=3396621 RepID=UPI003F5721A1
MTELLRCSDLEAGYGEIKVIKNLSIALNSGEILSIIGPNGAGKTTLMNTIIGVLTPSAGTIEFNGTEITSQSPSDRVSMGLTLVPEERHLFRDMSVRENLLLGAYTKRDGKRDERLKRVYNLFPRLDERQEQDAGTLSGGEAQMLTIGRSLMSDPDVLLLDEPSLGLAPKLIPEVFDQIMEINNEGVSVILVEQRAKDALKIADRGSLLENGEITLKGSADRLLNDDAVIEKYLGGGS